MSLFKTAALGLAASGLALTALPAGAAEFAQPGFRAAPAAEVANQWREQDRRYERQHDRYERRYERQQDRYERQQDRYERRSHRNGYGQVAYGEPVYRGMPTWRGRDGNTYCRKKDGTTGLIVGAAAGALLGREIDKHGNRTTGTLLGAAAGALLGKSVTGGTTCR